LGAFGGTPQHMKTKRGVAAAKRDIALRGPLKLKIQF